ncbi:zwei Ig domain protein zig-8 isoform X2 [Aethina tumida]|uniref:zwei Ig domain protein zig-8 isoform X2 n=1 Tax=Aethina tumida TaxID=116153 RepID=UPI00214745D2|nr:zwei Ig domain protein zig-8 isoform X2 [Aethina tumida]
MGCGIFRTMEIGVDLNEGYPWNVSDTNPGRSYVGGQHLALPPEFDDILIREVDATVGQTLLLPCTVKNLGDKVVSWIRSKDLHILTSGRHTFSSDSRFESVHSSSSGDFWGLRIRGVHISDTGQYECQVNTDPKMSLAIYLNVQVSGAHRPGTSDSKWVSQALIKGPREVYVQDGSPVTFTCEISPLSVASLQSGAHGFFFSSRPKVRWLHDARELASSEDNGKGIVITSAYTEDSMRLISTIHLPSVTWRDSGQYTCMQPSTKDDKVQLTVIEGEHSEAMQRDSPLFSDGVRCFPCTALVLICITDLFIVCNIFI